MIVTPPNITSCRTPPFLIGLLDVIKTVLHLPTLNFDDYNFIVNTLRLQRMLVAAGLLGALIVVAADLVGCTIFAPIKLPCGLITAAVEAPFFIYLLWQ